MINEKSVEMLNRALRDELAAVHQYMYFHIHLDDQGFDLVSKLFKRTAIEEMAHVEALAERILFLKGEVTMYPAEEVKPVHNLSKMLDVACGMETGSIRDYNQWANDCSANNDAGSKKVFEQLISDEERHFGQFDHELEMVKQFGPSYLALQSIERSKSIATGAPAEE